MQMSNCEVFLHNFLENKLGCGNYNTIPFRNQEKEYISVTYKSVDIFELRYSSKKDAFIMETPNMKGRDMGKKKLYFKSEQEINFLLEMVYSSCTELFLKKFVQGSLRQLPKDIEHLKPKELGINNTTIPLIRTLLHKGLSEIFGCEVVDFSHRRPDQTQELYPNVMFYFGLKDKINTFGDNNIEMNAYGCHTVRLNHLITTRRESRIREVERLVKTIHDRLT